MILHIVDVHAPSVNEVMSEFFTVILRVKSLFKE